MAKEFKITNHIRRLRFFANEMTQQQLAEMVEASRQTIVAIEASKYAPSLELAFRIANAFGVKIDEVFQCEVLENS
jgi:putative transcriptional regulator